MSNCDATSRAQSPPTSAPTYNCTGLGFGQLTGRSLIGAPTFRSSLTLRTHAVLCARWCARSCVCASVRAPRRARTWCKHWCLHIWCARSSRTCRCARRCVRWCARRSSPFERARLSAHVSAHRLSLYGRGGGAAAPRRAHLAQYGLSVGAMAATSGSTVPAVMACRGWRLQPSATRWQDEDGRHPLYDVDAGGNWSGADFYQSFVWQPGAPMWDEFVALSEASEDASNIVQQCIVQAATLQAKYAKDKALYFGARFCVKSTECTPDDGRVRAPHTDRAHPRSTQSSRLRPRSTRDCTA